MNALNLTNSTGVSLLASSNRPFKVNEFNSLTGQRQAGLASAGRSLNSRPSGPPTANGCQIIDRSGSDRTNSERSDPLKPASQFVHRPPTARTENGRPDRPLTGRIMKPQKKRSRKPIKQQSNQLQQKIGQQIRQQSSHIVQADQQVRPTVPGTVLASLANKISTRTAASNFAGKPTNIDRSNGELKSKPIEVKGKPSKDGQKTKVQNRFSWKSYLKETNSLAAPMKCFKANQMSRCANYFKPGMRLEAIDPSRPSLFCVASVVEVAGFRMRIHLDKYSSQLDFWVNCDSPFIFCVGFCAATGRRLQPPKNHQHHFDWSSYLHKEKAKAAPKHCFYWYNKSTDPPTGFKKGMKLEADEKSNASLVCVATIADLLGEWLLIHLDGLSADNDYWTEVDSPHIHPINWHKKQKLVRLAAPKDPTGSAFDWEVYLRKTESSAVISNVFRPRSQNTFKSKMKLEAVDPRNPRYVRVATVAARKAFAVKIHFDHFDPKLDFWLPDNSPDLHPVHWCLQANINLEPPSSGEFWSSSSSDSPASDDPDRNGIGQPKNPLNNTQVEDRSYLAKNGNYKELSDRLADAPNKNRSATGGLANSPVEREERTTECEMDRRSSSVSSADNSHLLVPSDSANSDQQELVKELHTFVNTLNPAEVLNWPPEKVADLVSILPRCLDLAPIFLDERLDGQSFLLLTHSDLVNILGIQRYQSFLIFSVICQIRRMI